MKMPKARRDELDRLFNSIGKKEWGEDWPTDGLSLEEFRELVTMRESEAESEKAFVGLGYKQLGIKPSDVKKADHDPDWSFFNFAGDLIRNTKDEWIKSRLEKAIEQNDRKFFIRYGEALKKPEKISRLTRLEVSMVCFWARWAGDIPPLNYFTDTALLDVLKIMTGNVNLTFEHVRKTRQRLGLKTKTAKIKGVKNLIVNGKKCFKFVWVDKADF